MKTICITVKNAKLIQRYFLRSGLLTLLVAKGARVVLLAPESEADVYRDEFRQSSVSIVTLPTMRLDGLASFADALSQFMVDDPGFIGYFRYKNARGIFTLPRLYARIIGIYLFRFIPGLLFLAERFLKYSGSTLRASKPLKAFFDEYKPDAIFATSLAESNFDASVIIEAKRRGIATAGTARGWSSIGANARYLVDPDLWLVQDKFMKEMAIKTQYVPENRIRVTGFPYFDWFVKKELIESREYFLGSLGIDPKKRVVLYAGSGEAVAEREVGFARIFDNLVKEGKIPSDVVMLFRPHPYHSTAMEEISHFKSGTWKSVVLDNVEIQNMKLPHNAVNDQTALAHLINSFAHCDMVITPGGTIFVEAAAFGKPLVALAFDSDQVVPFWLSFARRYDGTHFEYQELLATGGIKKVASAEELARSINDYLKDPQEDTAGYRVLRERFIKPCDGKSTERMADELLTLVA